MLSATMLAVSAPLVSTSVSASTVDSGNTQTFVVPGHSSTQELDSVQLNLSKEIANSGTVTYENGVKTFEISDDALDRAINDAYGNVFSSVLAARSHHHAGVTKVRYYGHGNFNIYLSKSMLNKIRADGYGAAFGVVVGLLGAAAGVPSMGVASVAISAVAKKLVGKMLAQVKPFKVGRVYKIRGWRYAGWRYQ